MSTQDRGLASCGIKGLSVGVYGSERMVAWRWRTRGRLLSRGRAVSEGAAAARVGGGGVARGSERGIKGQAVGEGCYSRNGCSGWDDGRQSPRH